VGPSRAMGNQPPELAVSLLWIPSQEWDWIVAMLSESGFKRKASIRPTRPDACPANRSAK